MEVKNVPMTPRMIVIRKRQLRKTPDFWWKLVVGGIVCIGCVLLKK